MKLTLFFAVLMSLALAGCGDKAQEYDINVTNRTSSPVTIWLTQDRCDGTLIRVFRGRVVVHSASRRHELLIGAGQSYFARAPR